MANTDEYRARISENIASGGILSISPQKLREVLFKGADLLDIIVTTITHVRVNTFAEMLELCEAGISKNFTVVSDEYQDDTNVIYKWDGAILFEYGISQCDIQP